MKRIGTGVLLVALVLGCKSPHKLTGSNYIDLSQGTGASDPGIFPGEISDSLEWGDLTQIELKEGYEEIRFTMISDKEPFHLIRITKGKKDIEGESLLFWPKEREVDIQNPHNNMFQYLNQRCGEFRETAQYDYCFPNYDNEPNWGGMYAALENSQIWTLPDGAEMSQNTTPADLPWTINIQVRVGNYYREYTHSNPEKYSSSEEYFDLMAVISQLKGLTSNFQYAENFDIYEGITSGALGSKFYLCDQSEVWRFNSDLGDLITRSGIPAQVDIQDSLMFYIKLQGEVYDEWYSEREKSGFLRTIVATEINDLAVVNELKCPSLD